MTWEGAEGHVADPDSLTHGTATWWWGWSDAQCCALAVEEDPGERETLKPASTQKYKHDQKRRWHSEI